MADRSPTDMAEKLQHFEGKTQYLISTLYNKVCINISSGLFSVGFIIRKIAFCQTIFKSEINREPDPKNGAVSYGFYRYVDHYFCIENALLSVKGDKHSPVRLRSSVGLCVCVCECVFVGHMCWLWPRKQRLIAQF